MGEPHRWKARPASAAPLWKPGQSGNPGGRLKGITTKHNTAVKAMISMLERVMAEPEIMADVESQFRRAITTNAPKAIREYLIPFMPVVTASQSEDAAGNIVRRLSVSQLQAIAAEIPGEKVGDKTIEIPQDDTESPHAENQ